MAWNINKYSNEDDQYWNVHLSNKGEKYSPRYHQYSNLHISNKDEKYSSQYMNNI